jgi:hypothetical protein
VKADFSPAKGFGAGAVPAGVVAAGVPVESCAAAADPALDVVAASGAVRVSDASASAGSIRKERILGFGTVSLHDDSGGR